MTCRHRSLSAPCCIASAPEMQGPVYRDIARTVSDEIPTPVGHAILDPDDRWRQTRLDHAARQDVEHAVAGVLRRRIDLDVFVVRRRHDCLLQGVRARCFHLVSGDHVMAKFYLYVALFPPVGIRQRQVSCGVCASAPENERPETGKKKEFCHCSVTTVVFQVAKLLSEQSLQSSNSSVMSQPDKLDGPVRIVVQSARREAECQADELQQT